MKKLTILAAVFALSACLLTGCRFGKDDTTTTSGNPHTLPETTGATITMPTVETTQPTVDTTQPSSNGNGSGMNGNGSTNGGANGGMNGNGSTNGGMNGNGTTGGTDSGAGTGSTRSRHITSSKY